MWLRFLKRTKFVKIKKYSTQSTKEPINDDKIPDYWILLKLYMKSATFPLDWEAPVDIPAKNLNKIQTSSKQSPTKITPDTLTQKLCEEYLSLNKEDKEQFLNQMSIHFGYDEVDLEHSIENYVNEKNRGTNFNEKRMTQAKQMLRNSLVPIYENLFDTIIKQKYGMKFIVDLRKDLLEILKDKSSPNLLEMNINMKNILSNWFSMGFLSLVRYTWEYPAFILEKIILNEKVHPMNGWDDLKRRVGLSRRLYGFVHPSMHDEPLVFIQVCLTDKISNNIQEILNNSGTLEQEMNANTAIFYSISNTQDGLNGVELGNFLIKRVVGVLQQENKNIKTFSTLSPIPGFTKWLLTKLHFHTLKVAPVLETKILTNEEEQLLLSLDQTQSNPYDILKQQIQSGIILEELKGIMMRLCATYLYVEKKRGKTLDPVANFHIKNGAIMYRLNWHGDLSKSGIKSSYGIMINYKYELDQIEKNNESYVLDGIIAIGDEFKELLPKSILN